MKLKSTAKMILFATVCFIFLSNCKKGEDDPVLSLRTRKARVVGDWHLEGGSVSLTYNQSGKAPFSQQIVFSKSQYNITETYQGGIPTIYVGDYALSMSFKKDGKFELTEVFSKKTIRASGTWNFTAGVGEVKKKEGIVITLDGVSAGGTNNLLFCKFSTELNYTIKELKNKRIVLISSNPLYLDSDGSRTIYSSNYSMIQ